MHIAIRAGQATTGHTYVCTELYSYLMYGNNARITIIVGSAYHATKTLQLHAQNFDIYKRIMLQLRANYETSMVVLRIKNTATTLLFTIMV